MNKLQLTAAVLSLAGVFWTGEARGATLRAPDPNPVDVCVQSLLQERGIEPAELCSDEVFIRRVYVDVIGTLPEPAETLAFLGDHSPDKRSKVIAALLERPEFSDYWALKWCDALRVKAEFPINLWPNAVQAYHRWIHDSIRDNKPYDQFVREMLTSSGSDFRRPPVNFYRAIQGRDPAAIAAAVGLSFMGTRLAKWPEPCRAGITAFFTRVAYKKTDEWKEEIVCLDPKPADPVDAVFPDGVKVRIPMDKDPRAVFADWLITPENPWFARSVVNRVWAWLFGRGIIQEPDDIPFYEQDNPAANPQLLDRLAKELVKAHFDLRHIYWIILNSRTYQQSCVPRAASTSSGADGAALCAYYPVRRLDAEVLIDALCWIGGEGESYSSATPEPFTFIPKENRTIALADGSITSSFLEMFGRPARDTGLYSERNNQPTDEQRLYLLNGTEVQREITRSPRLRALLAAARGNRRELVRSIYLMLLSRYPTASESASAEKSMQTGGPNLMQSANDLTWALINTKEFLYRH